MYIMGVRVSRTPLEEQTMGDNTKIIALVGKGGVGKTSLSALIVGLLAKHHPNSRILAIDADPAVGLATALGVEISSTVDDIRKTFIETVEEGDTRAAIELLGEARYHMTDALVETENIAFLAIGRPEAAGCYCKVNGYLKEVIGRIAEHFDYVVIDGEAGIEQVNRRVMEKVTHLILVSDASKKGLQVVSTIHHVAKEMVMFQKAGLIVNRIPDVALGEVLNTGELELLTCIPDDKQISYSDMMGRSIFDIPADSTALQGAEEALRKLNLIEKGAD